MPESPGGATKLMVFRIFFSFFLSNLKRRKTHFPGREFDFIFALEQTGIERSNAF
jgi:hypothetical protein